MPRTIWNEGRVVGFSAYEEYVRLSIGADPDTPPSSEKEWLASTLAYGTSMLLWVAPDYLDPSSAGYHYRDIQFPDNCNLCGANTIIASFFDGEGGKMSNLGWAQTVESYGSLINNNSTSSPSGTVGPTGTIPPASIDSSAVSATTVLRLQNYLKIFDGIIIQPGVWSTNSDTPPAKDFTPTLSEKPRIRLGFSGPINEGFWVLLTGFTDRGIINVLSNHTTAVSSEAPQNGDFLGPGTYPWAAKVLFSITTNQMNIVTNSGYARSLPSTATAESVSDAPIIDVQSFDMNSYYHDAFSNSSVLMNVTQISFINNYGAIMALYQNEELLPGALYTSRVASGFTGAKSLYPVDVVAPGTVKMFNEDLTGDVTATRVELAEAVQAIHHNIGLYQSDSYVVYEINTDATASAPDRYLPISDDVTTDLSALTIYNTRYVWFNCPPSQGDAPSQTDLQDVKTMQNIRIISGYMSDYFVSRYCVDYATAVAACAEGHICDSMYRQKAYIDQLVTKYGQTYVENNYKFFFMSSFFRIQSASQNGMFYPIRLENNQIITTLGATESGGSINVSHGFNFSSSSITIDGVTIPSVSSDILGTYYGLTPDGGGTTVSLKDSDDNYVFQAHPMKYLAVTEYSEFDQPQAAVPKVPSASQSKFGINFVAWLESTPVSDMFADDGAALTAMGVHESYFDLDMQSFMQYLVTGRDMSKPITDIPGNAKTLEKRYLYTASDISDIADPDWAWDGTTTKYGGIIAETYKSVANYYQAADVTLWTYHVSGDESIEDDDVTKQYLSTSHHTWGAVGTSGKHSTSAISLVDSFGGRLPLTGNSGTIENRYITWERLLDALNNNKAIDPVGLSIVTCTQQEYTDMSSHDANTLYIITGGST